MKNNELVKYLIDNNLTITTCESCTGGMIASNIIDVSGSSNVLKEAYITYAVSSKINLVGCDENIINKYGVVSKQTASEMANKSRIKAESNLSISATGIAGPTGGDILNPVGTVCFGFNINGEIKTVKKVFKYNDRNKNRKAAARFAVDYMYKLLTK